MGAAGLAAPMGYQLRNQSHRRVNHIDSIYAEHRETFRADDRRLHTQQTPDSLIELEALVRAVQIVTRYLERPAGAAGRNNVKVAGWPHAHLRAFPVGEPVVHEIIRGRRLVRDDRGPQHGRAEDGAAALGGPSERHWSRVWRFLPHMTV